MQRIEWEKQSNKILYQLIQTKFIVKNKDNKCISAKLCIYYYLYYNILILPVYLTAIDSTPRGHKDMRPVSLDQYDLRVFNVKKIFSNSDQWSSNLIEAKLLIYYVTSVLWPVQRTGSLSSIFITPVDKTLSHISRLNDWCLMYLYIILSYMDGRLIK